VQLNNIAGPQPSSVQPPSSDSGNSSKRSKVGASAGRSRSRTPSRKAGLERWQFPLQPGLQPPTPSLPAVRTVRATRSALCCAAVLQRSLPPSSCMRLCMRRPAAAGVLMRSQGGSVPACAVRGRAPL
jgi:hypothetical protein